MKESRCPLTLIKTILRNYLKTLQFFHVVESPPPASMSSKKREEPAGADEVGPGHAYLPFVVMEDLLDKLKLINYDSEFTTQFKIKPISRHCFAVPTNPGEQFYIFSSLAAWLIQQSGMAFETPQESDDPNTTISNILDVVRSMGTSIAFPPSRLKQGWGEHVIFVLDHLADKTLKKKHFTWKMSSYFCFTRPMTSLGWTS